MMTEENFVDFKCPHCQEVVSFPSDHPGGVQECPLCSESMVVPTDGSGVGRIIPIPITTARLVLRRLRGIDWKELMELFSDEEIFRYLEGRPLTEEEVTHWLESDSHVKLTSPDQMFYLGMEAQGSDKFLGYLSLRFVDPQRLQASLSIVLSRPHQRKGLGVEAVSGLLDFCFDGIGLHRVTAYCDSRNVAAGRLFEKAGLRREGEFLKDRQHNGEWVNTVWYALLREENQHRKAALS
jgi:RimJ/RimL family protein N-acetyltransferase